MIWLEIQANGLVPFFKASSERFDLRSHWSKDRKPVLRLATILVFG